jgi:3-oxoadipate enol-lactonase
MMTGTNPRGAAAALRGMMERPDQTHLLPSILAPTLIVVGSEDQITPVKDAEVMHREIRGSHLEVIEGAGHVSNMERPAEFNQAVRVFLDSLQP